MLKLFLIRHGETEWNTDFRLQGISDIPLNSYGKEQAQALGRALSKRKITHIYSSDLARAWDTAQIIRTYQNVPIYREPRLREISFGLWEGLKDNQIRQQYPKMLKNWHDDPSTITPPHGETVEKVATRVQSFFNELKNSHSQGCIAIVSHGTPLRVMLCNFFGLSYKSLWSFKFDNASFTEIHVFSKKASLVRFNDTCHIVSS